jgi:hypothetical protein
LNDLTRLRVTATQTARKSPNETANSGASGGETLSLIERIEAGVDRLAPVRAVALLSVLAAGLFAGMAAAPVYAQERQPAQATQHALDELANALAQGKITLTPTSTPTFTPTPTPTLIPTATPEPTETDTPVPTAIPTMPIADGEQPSNAYLRPGPEDWLELALPQGRWIIQSTDCNLTPWTQVSYHTSDPRTAGVNDCPLSAWQQVSETPCAMSDAGVCDLLSDESYLNYLSGLLTPTETPAPATLTPTPTPRAAALAQAAAPPPPPPEPIYIVVTATPEPDDPTPTWTPRPTATIRSTATATRTRTPVPTATQFPTSTAVPTPTVLAVAAVADRLPPLPFDWTGVFIVLAALASAAGITVFVVRKLRQRHLAQLAELEGVAE